MQWSDLQIVEKLGEGKAGDVWLAINNDRRTQAEFPKVAVKRYKAWITEQKGQMERILREREIGYSVRHPNLVRVVELVFDDHKLPALVMQHCPGQTLEDYLVSKAYKLEFDEILKIIRALSCALSVLHGNQVIHRDVKPTNVMMVDGIPVLMDLGVIKSEGFPEQTTTGQFFGTIRYAAPEALFGQDYDRRVDIFGLGLVLDECLSRQRHMDTVENWAEMIVRKHEWRYSYGVRSPSLKKSISLAQVDFLNNLSYRTTCGVDHRVDDVSWVIEAIDSRIWERVFHMQDGEFVNGEPLFPDVRRGGGFNGPAPLKEAADLLLSRIDSRQKRVLRELIAADSELAIYQRQISSEDYKCFASVTEFFKQWWDETEMGLVMHMEPGVWLLYRYGYLD